MDRNTNQYKTADWKPDHKVDHDVKTAVHTLDPPYQKYYFGVFGANLESATQNGTPQTLGLLAMLNTLTFSNGTSKGFIVNASSSAPSLTIGVPSDTSAFTTFKMNYTPETGYDHAILNQDYTLTSASGSSLSLSQIPTMLDTGTSPDEAIHITADSTLYAQLTPYLLINSQTDSAHLLAGTTISLNIAGIDYSLTSTEENPIAVYQKDRSEITYGLNIFQQFQIMYDLENNRVGFAPVPEPSAIALCLLAFGATTLVRRRYFLSSSKTR